MRKLVTQICVLLLIIDISSTQHDDIPQQYNVWLGWLPFFSNYSIAQVSVVSVSIIINDQSNQPNKQSLCILPNVTCHGTGGFGCLHVEGTRDGEPDSQVHTVDDYKAGPSLHLGVVIAIRGEWKESLSTWETRVANRYRPREMSSP